MIGTLFGLLTALLLLVYPGFTASLPDENLFAVVLVGVSTLLLFIKHFLNAQSFGPLQKAELKVTPRIVALFKLDKSLQFISCYLSAFAIISYLIAFNISVIHLVDRNLSIAAWVILLGFSLDALHYYTKRILSYISPYTAIKLIAEEGARSIQNEREIDLCDWLDSLGETAVKAIITNTPSLAMEAIDRSQDLIKTFLESAKSIAHHEKDKQTEKLGIQDKISYTLFYSLERLAMINGKALESHSEIVVNHLITAVGKIIIYAAKYDFSLTTEPLHSFSQFTKRAQETGHLETTIRASLTLMQLCKVLLSEIDVTYLEIKETFLDIIGKMETLAKETFKADKSTRIAILMQPFMELKELFSSEKLSAHQDTPAIQQDINRILTELQTLELVMRTLPPMPKITEEAEAPKE